MASSSNAILTIFKSFDRNGDGTISYEDLARVLRSLDAWSEDDITDLLKAVEIDSNGKIQLREFVAWVFGEEICQQALGPAPQDSQDSLIRDAPLSAPSEVDTQAPIVEADSVSRDVSTLVQLEAKTLTSSEVQQDSDLLQGFVALEEPNLIILDKQADDGVASSKILADNLVQALIDAPGIRDACEQQPWNSQGNKGKRTFETWKALWYTTHAQEENNNHVKYYSVNVAICEAGAQADGSYEQEFLELELSVTSNANGVANPPVFIGASMPMTLLEDAVSTAGMQVSIEENYVKG